MHECTPIAWASRPRRTRESRPGVASRHGSWAPDRLDHTCEFLSRPFSRSLSLSPCLSVSHFRRKLLTGIMQTRAASYAARERVRRRRAARGRYGPAEKLSPETRQCLRAPDLCHAAVPASAALQPPPSRPHPSPREANHHSNKSITPSHTHKQAHACIFRKHAKRRSHRGTHTHAQAPPYMHTRAYTQSQTHS